MYDIYDIIVVGAGPAGSTAAKYACMNGAKTLIIEKRKEVGIPVRCGEFLPTLSEVYDLMPEAEDIDELFDIKESLISRKTDKLRVISPKGNEYEFKFNGMVLERKLYDKFLADESVKSGAELITGTKVLDVQKSGSTTKVVTGDEVYIGKIVIGADGPISTVAKFSGMQKPELSPCVNYELPGEFESVIEMHIGGAAPGGYAWVIPKKDTANVGLGVQRKFAKKLKLNLKELLDKFVEKLNLEKTPINYSGGNVPSSGPVSETVKDNVMLVGDSAGHVMASNGGGIPIALICGKIAGEVSAEHIKSNGKTPLQEYEKRWRKQVGETLANSLKTKKIADMAFGSEMLLELAIRKLGSRGMEEVVRCKSINPLRYVL